MFEFKSCLLVLLGAFIFVSCSKEEPTLETEQRTSKFEPFSEIVKETSDLTRNTEQSCIADMQLLESGYAGVTSGSGKYKTMIAGVYQSFNSITINATYVIDSDLENLPARISISLENEEILFDDVIPGETISHSFDYPENWHAGDELNYQIDQKVYLAPISIVSSFQLLPYCEINIGDSILGGLVAHIYQPGEEGYVEGETHGIILNTSTSISGNWYDATEWANNLNNNSYNDWSLPTIEELELLMTDLPQYFEYDNLYYYGYWSSTNYEPIDGWAYAGTLTGKFLEPLVYAPQPFDKSNTALYARAVRYF